MKIFHSVVDFSILIGKTLIDIQESSDSLWFKDAENNEYSLLQLHPDGASVTLDDIVGDLDDLLNTPILFAEEVSGDTGKSEDYESYTYTFYKLATVKGWVDIKFFGTSSGYYSEKADFIKYRSANENELNVIIRDLKNDNERLHDVNRVLDYRINTLEKSRLFSQTTFKDKISDRLRTTHNIENIQLHNYTFSIANSFFCTIGESDNFTDYFDKVEIAYKILLELCDTIIGKYTYSHFIENKNDMQSEVCDSIKYIIKSMPDYKESMIYKSIQFIDTIYQQCE